MKERMKQEATCMITLLTYAVRDVYCGTANAVVPHNGLPRVHVS
jgi:hypothetical protein